MEPGEWPGILISAAKVNEEPVMYLIRAEEERVVASEETEAGCQRVGGREIGPLNCSRERQAGDCSQAGPVLCSNDISASSIVLPLLLACRYLGLPSAGYSSLASNQDPAQAVLAANPVVAMTI